jgi:hypothetical protein
MLGMGSFRHREQFAFALAQEITLLSFAGVQLPVGSIHDRIEKHPGVHFRLRMTRYDFLASRAAILHLDVRQNSIP